MTKEWIKGKAGRNYKFKREVLLNYATNRWKLNQAHSVDGVMALIRKCAPKSFLDWKKYYFRNAKQKKKDGKKINKEYIISLGKGLFSRLTKDVRSELDSIKNEEECICFIYNLVLNRTYEGYKNEIEVINKNLKKKLCNEICPATDTLDRKYSVDYYINVNSRKIGLQIKPIESGVPLDDYQWYKMHDEAHKKFKKEFGGSVFFVFSSGKRNDKKIHNTEVIKEIKAEIERLKK